MSALARLYLSRGALVTGSDLRENNLTRDLVASGAVISYGHNVKNLPECTDAVVYSTSIRKDNPELLKARSLSIPLVPRVMLLKEALKMFRNIVGITGTHGKTTTSGLISHIFWKCNMDPTALLGGESLSFGSNTRIGSEEVVVAEVDESDGFFSGIEVGTAVLTNIEKEHMEHYSSFDEILDSYRIFLSNIPAGGSLVYNFDDPVASEIANSSGLDTVSFGQGRDALFSCQNSSSSRGVEFDLHIDGWFAGRVKSPLVGDYNVMNILAALACAWKSGIPIDEAIDSVLSFQGMLRRFQIVSRFRDICVVEDYAHHPTEVRAVINAAKAYTDGRVITVFQPHRYSRTISLFEDFSDCFKASDALFLTDIYSADEKPIEGATSKKLFDRIEKSGFFKSGLIDKEAIPREIKHIADEGDIVLVLGAGDIGGIAERISFELSSNETAQKRI